jgi:hypothetical protein
MIPSDWYVMLLNEIDEKLTERGLDTRIVFIAYLDTIFAPEKVSFNNKDRFALLYAPISRSYTKSIDENTKPAPLEKYVRNKWKQPTDMGATLSYLDGWQRVFDGMAFSYEYHFWRHQFLDPGIMTFARQVHTDVRSLNFMGLSGLIEDGSQRSGFPNGFGVYVLAETLMDRDVEFDTLVEDYFSHAYGKDWKQVQTLMEKLSQAFDFHYMEGAKSADPAKGDYYNPEHVQSLQKVN